MSQGEKISCESDCPIPLLLPDSPGHWFLCATLVPHVSFVSDLAVNCGLELDDVPMALNQGGSF
jgi:hypothetical protein